MIAFFTVAVDIDDVYTSSISKDEFQGQLDTALASIEDLLSREQFTSGIHDQNVEVD